MRQGVERVRWLLGRIAAELGIIAIAGVVYVVVRKVTQGSPETAIDNAHALLRFEQAVNLDHEHAFQQLALDSDWVRNAANWMYIWGHWPVIICVAVALWFVHHTAYVRLRNAVFVSGMIGFLFFALMPMAPPRLAGLGYVDTVTQWSGSYRVMQPPQYTNIYAAMPSLHFGWDLLVGVTLFLSSTVLIVRIIGLALPIGMWFAVIATGNHWILDTVVAVGVVLVGAAIREAARAYFAMRTARSAGEKRRQEAGIPVCVRTGGRDRAAARTTARAHLP